MGVDDEILELLDESGLRLTPNVLSENLDRDRSGVNNRLIELEEKGFVSRPKRGMYEIDEDGRKYLRGELDASKID